MWVGNSHPPLACKILRWGERKRPWDVGLELGKGELLKLGLLGPIYFWVLPCPSSKEQLGSRNSVNDF